MRAGQLPPQRKARTADAKTSGSLSGHLLPAGEDFTLVPQPAGSVQIAFYLLMAASYAVVTIAGMRPCSLTMVCGLWTCLARSAHDLVDSLVSGLWGPITGLDLAGLAG
jgi:hypothetical protein